MYVMIDQILYVVMTKICHKVIQFFYFYWPYLFIFVQQLDGKGGFEEFLEDSSGFGDWCERKFAKRAVVGTLYADEDEMEGFATVNSGSWPGSTFVRYSQYQQD